MGLVLIANHLPSHALGVSSVAPGAAGFVLCRWCARACAVKHSAGSLVHFAARPEPRTCGYLGETRFRLLSVCLPQFFPHLCSSRASTPYDHPCLGNWNLSLCSRNAVCTLHCQIWCSSDLDYIYTMGNLGAARGIRRWPRYQISFLVPCESSALDLTLLFRLCSGRLCYATTVCSNHLCRSAMEPVGYRSVL